MKIGALSRSMRSLSHNVVLCYEKSSLRQCACLTKLQKLLSRVVGSLLLANHNRLLSGEFRPFFFSFNYVSGCKIRLQNSRIPSRLNINFFLPNCFLPTHTRLLLKRNWDHRRKPTEHHIISNIQALRGSKFAKFCKGCVHPRPVS